MGAIGFDRRYVCKKGNKSRANKRMITGREKGTPLLSVKFRRARTFSLMLMIHSASKSVNHNFDANLRNLVWLTSHNFLSPDLWGRPTLYLYIRNYQNNKRKPEPRGWDQSKLGSVTYFAISYLNLKTITNTRRTEAFPAVEINVCGSRHNNIRNRGIRDDVR